MSVPFWPLLTGATSFSGCTLTWQTHRDCRGHALDGKGGGALRKTRIVVKGSKIVAIDPKAKPID
jgi:hypothetical protein